MSGSNGVPPRDMDDDTSPVGSARRGGLTTMQKVGVALLVTVILLAFVWLRAIHPKEAVEAQAQAPVTVGEAMHAAPVALEPPPAPRPTLLPLPEPTQFRMFTPPRHEETPADSPIFAFTSGSTPTVAPARVADAQAAEATSSQRPAPDNALSSRLKPTVLSGVKAQLLPHPDMMITEGTVIPCILETAIDSQLAGYVKCVLPVDVRGTTGSVVLLDKGTTVVGEIQQGLVQGQNRVFVLWDRAETPEHAVIELSSPGTDELGRSGLPGRVNNHWWGRFGDAIMLSVIQGGLNAGTALASNSGSNNGTTAVFNSFQSNGQQVADTALQAEINIPPTLTKNQGDTVAIFVAKDLDFSDVYGLRVTGTADDQ